MIVGDYSTSRVINESAGNTTQAGTPFILLLSKN
jgi:hypothetical protein